ncbi:MAG TPA: bacterioferritin [Desulfotomaculum sp.]|nr:bacterioferritin [Desulfotomaculum sp.]
MNDKKNDTLWLKCSTPGPYPEIKVVRPNLFYAQLLMEDYAGVVSELSAIGQYVYHYITFEEKHKELAELEECISLVEMHHLEMLAQVIRMLGGNPQYKVVKNNQDVYWNSSYIYYGQEICDRLASDIEGEKAAITQYQQHYKLIADPYIQRLLERIIQDETYHIQLLTQALQKHCPY